MTSLTAEWVDKAERDRATALRELRMGHAKNIVSGKIGAVSVKEWKVTVMSKIEQEFTSQNSHTSDESVAAEYGADAPEVFTLLPLSRTPMIARVIKMQPAPFVYVTDDALLSDSEE